MKRLELHLGITPAVATAIAADRLRIVIVYDRQPNGALAAWQDVFSNFDQVGAADVSEWAMPNITNLDRFLVLKDIRKSLPAQTTAGLPDNANIQMTMNEMKWSWNINLMNLETAYSTSTGAIGDIKTGALYLFNRDGVGGNVYNLTLTTRLVFADR